MYIIKLGDEDFEERMASDPWLYNTLQEARDALRECYTRDNDEAYILELTYKVIEDNLDECFGQDPLPRD